MATEPTTLKTTLAVAAVSLLGPLGGEHALILAGAFGGAMLSLQRAEPLPKWWQPITHVASGIVAAMLCTSSGSWIIARMAPADLGISADMLWVPLSAVVAMFWREGFAFIPALLKRKFGGSP